MKILFLVLLFPILSCQNPVNPYDALSAGKAVEIRGWIHPLERIGDLPMLRDEKGREYGIENLPKKLEDRSVQIKAKARYSRKVDLPSSANKLIIRLTDIQPGRPEIKRWDDLIEAAYSDQSRFVRALNAILDEIGMPLPFWPTTQSEPSERVVGFNWSGCGYLYNVFVKTISRSLQGNSLRADAVLELNEKGEIIRRWSIPGNGFVDGLQGDRLLVATGASTLFRSTSRQGERGLNLFLAIAPDGGFRVIEIKRKLSESVQMTCPNMKEFEGSAYARCAVFKDAETGQSRRLAYQGPCT